MSISYATIAKRAAAQKSSSPISIIACLFAASLLCYGAIFSLTPARIGFTEDMGLSLAVAQSMRDGHTVMLGPPSHRGGRHLGPIGYWYVKAALELGNGDPFSAFVIIAALEFLAFLALAALCMHITPSENRWWTGALVLLLGSSTTYFNIFIYPWHPHFLITTSVAFLIAAMMVMGRHPLGSGAMLLSASLLIQLHYSAAIFVGIVGIAAVATCSLKSPKGDTHPRFLRFLNHALWVAALLTWVPLIWFEWHYPGTLQKTLFSNTVHASTHAGLRPALQTVWDFLGGMAFGKEPFFWASNTVRLTALLLEAGLALYFLGRALIHSSTLERVLLISCLLALMAYIPVLAWLAYPLFVSFLLALSPLPGLFMGAALGQVVSRVRSRSAWSKILALCFLILFLANAAPQCYKNLGSDYYHIPWHSLEHAQQIVKIINQDRKGAPIHLVTKSSSRFMQAPLLYLLGPQYYPQIAYWNEIAELSEISGLTPREAQSAYVLACPRPMGAYRKQIEMQMAADWEKDAELDLKSCLSGSECRLFRYKRRTSMPDEN